MLLETNKDDLKKDSRLQGRFLDTPGEKQTVFLFGRGGSRTQNDTRRLKSLIQTLIIRKQTDDKNLCGSLDVFMVFEPPAKRADELTDQLTDELTGELTSRKKTKTGRVKQNPFKIK